MTCVRYQDVFVPGGFPRHTYNPRVDLQLEAKLAEVRESLFRLVAVTGQTKSGKTVLVRKMLPPEETIWIDGGTVSDDDEFWQVIIDRLDLFQNVTESSSQHVGGEVSGSAKVRSLAVVLTQPSQTTKGSIGDPAASQTL